MMIHYRGKKITCPSAQDKLNFRQDKHIFSPNVPWTSKKFTDSLFFLDKDKLFGNRTSKNFDVLARGTSENFLDIFYPCIILLNTWYPLIKDMQLQYINNSCPARQQSSLVSVCVYISAKNIFNTQKTSKLSQIFWKQFFNDFVFKTYVYTNVNKQHTKNLSTWSSGERVINKNKFF